MFIYWDGFEIDGSDTDFNIVLPENVQVQEFVDCFLAIPIFSRDIEPSVSYYKNNQEYKLTLDKLKEMLLSGNFPDISIDINCLHLERLPSDLYAKIYALSERREPHEKAFGKVENPCTAPVIQKHYTRGEMTVELKIQTPETQSRGNNDFEFDGYINNIELLRSVNKGLNCLEINVGPGFYYEYAVFIIDYLRDSFPGLGTWGGLDCANGWTDGCTYAASIYNYEKIQFPVTFSIKNTLKRLTEYNIVRSYKSYYKNGWQYDYTNGFYLANHAPVEPGKTLKPISFEEYIELVDTAVALDTDSFTKVCDTAVLIKLPPPEDYAENPEAVKLLKAVLPDADYRNINWYFTGYLAFTAVEDKPVCEFRVHYILKDYFLTLFKLMYSGMIEFIKSKTYERRHD